MIVKYIKRAIIFIAIFAIALIALFANLRDINEILQAVIIGSIMGIVLLLSSIIIFPLRKKHKVKNSKAKNSKVKNRRDNVNLLDSNNHKDRNNNTNKRDYRDTEIIPRITEKDIENSK